MSKIEDFLSAQEEQEIVDAIKTSELKTSGEIRVHIEKTALGDAKKRAVEIFYLLKMNNTKLQNAVLIYLAVHDRVFTIYGDEGINQVVPNNFWNNTKEIMEQHFKKGHFKKGLIEGILKSGEQLKKYFPYTDSDTNELSNEISKG